MRKKIDLEALVASQIARALAPGGAVDQEEKKKAKERDAAKAKARNRVSRNLQSAKNQISAARKRVQENDKKKILCFIDEVAPKLPEWAASLSEGNGYKIVFNLYKSDLGKYGCEILLNGAVSTKVDRTFTDRALEARISNKAYRDERLLKELKKQGVFNCTSEAEMMQEILNLRKEIQGMHALADAEREAKEAK